MHVAFWMGRCSALAVEGTKITLLAAGSSLDPKLATMNERLKVDGAWLLNNFFLRMVQRFS
jgi:hypothetical protein